MLAAGLTTADCGKKITPMGGRHRHVIFRDREEFRRTRRALPSLGRKQRKGTRILRTRGRHSGDSQATLLLAARPALAEIQQRVTRLLRTPGITHLDVALAAADASAGARVARIIRSRAFVIALITCAITAGVVAAAPNFRLAHRPQTPVAGRTAPRSSATVSSSASPRHNAVKQPPVGDGPGPGGARQTTDAPRAGAAPHTSDVQSEPAAPPQHDLYVDVQDLPAARDDPDLEAALSDLDKQADLDESMRRQPGPGQPPPLTPDAGPPVARTIAQP